jgi:hypothetical protein
MSGRPSILSILGRGLLGAVGAAVAAPILVFVLGFIATRFDSTCGTPGDSGGCEMWLGVAAISSVLPAAGVGFVIGAVRAWRRPRVA